MRSLSLILLAAAVILGGCASNHRQQGSQANAAGEVKAAATEFVSAFNALDQARFDGLWAEDAAVFFPQPPFPIRRVEGKAQVLSWFKRFMDAQRSAGKSPGVDPNDLLVQMIGPTAAVVSFHLGSEPSAAARRTLVYRKDASGWRIVHLHGSALRAEER